VNETPLALALGLPRDGGFGQIPTNFGSFGNTEDLPGFPHFDLEEFNSPPVVESADTGPFFHNHTAKTLEEAVAFYGTQPFQISIPAIRVPVTISADPNDSEVQAIGAFLRVLNALENIRSSINIAERARTMTHQEDVRDLARLAIAETSDAMNVLSVGALERNIEAGIQLAKANLHATTGLLVSAQHAAGPAVDVVLNEALKSLRAARSALADPATLPASYRN
jgi:hypothetical protein